MLVLSFEPWYPFHWKTILINNAASSMAHVYRSASWGLHTGKNMLEGNDGISISRFLLHALL